MGHFRRGRSLIGENQVSVESLLSRLQNAAYELVIEGESYRKRQKPLTSPLPESEPVRTRQRPTG